MNQRQWFQGKLEGQYVGRPKSRRESVASRAGESFEIEITRAAVAEILLGPLVVEREQADIEHAAEPPPAESKLQLTEPTHHHQGSGDTFHQASIAQVFFLEAMGAGRTVRSGAHDVLVTDLELTHGARKDGKIYGMIRGTASGWYRPLPPLPVPVEVIPPERPREVWRSEVQIPSEAMAQAVAPPSKAAAAERRGSIVDTGSETSDASPKEDASVSSDGSVTAYAETDLPFFILGSLLAVGLFVVAGWFAALTWYMSFLPALGLRRWLYGIIPEGWATRAFAIAVVAVQFLVATLLIAGWQETGCKSLNPLILALLVCGQYVCCLLPRALAFAVATTALAAVIAHFYGPFGSICP